MKRPYFGFRRLRRTSHLVVLLSVCAFASTRAFSVVPDWVRAAANQTTMPVDKDVNGIVMLDEQTTNVQDTGEVLTLERRVIKILRPEGRELARVHVFFDNETKLKSFHAWSVTATGTEYEVKEKEFQERDLDGRDELYSDVRVKEAVVPGADPGTVIAFEYEQRNRPYLMEDTWQFQERLPVEKARYTLRLPSTWEYANSWFGHAEIKPAETGANTWTWELGEISGIEREPHMPSWRSIAGRMVISYFGNVRGQAAKSARSWTQIGSWYNDLTAGRRQASPEIHDRALQLTAGKSSFIDKVGAIASFLQGDIRYVAIEIGIGGFQPHSASDVFRKRYGDCKDKATLMSSMLHEVGIESYYLVVNTNRGEVAPGAPSTRFNHVVLAIAVPKGDLAESYPAVISLKSRQYLIFDPTDQYTPVGQLHYQLQGGYGLLVTDAGGELVLIPVFAPIGNQLKRVAHLKLQPDGSLAGEVSETRTGEHAWNSRAQLLNTRGNERSKALEGFLGTFLNGFSLEKSESENLERNDRDLILKYDFTARNYAKNAGPLLLVRPRVLGAKELQLATDKPRKFPIEFAAATHETDIFEIEIPQGYLVDELPDPVKVDVGFAQYESKTELTGQILRYTRDYTVNQLQVPTAQEAQLKRLFATIYSDERNSAVLKKQ